MRVWEWRKPLLYTFLIFFERLEIRETVNSIENSTFFAWILYLFGETPNIFL